MAKHQLNMAAHAEAAEAADRTFRRTGDGITRTGYEVPERLRGQIENVIRERMTDLKINETAQNRAIAHLNSREGWDYAQTASAFSAGAHVPSLAPLTIDASKLSIPNFLSFFNK